jgi:acyl-CoA reductase-like NAD-dependent aldehyde dehydrogenase
MGAPWNFNLFIDNKWVEGEKGGRIEVIDPATEAVIGSVAEATPNDAIKAIKAARKAFDEGPWPWMTPAARGAILNKMADYLEAHGAQLRELIVAETGSVGMITDFIQAGGSIGMLRANANLAQHEVGWLEMGPPSAAGATLAGSAVIREPIGVVAAITPFNFPFMLNIVKSAPALAAGCTMVLKPHPWTALDAFLIAQAAEAAGLPPGVLNVISGHGEVGDELTSNPMVDMVTFTGSTATGKRILGSAAGTVKRVQLELGGKSAQILLDDVGEEYAHSVGFGAVLTHCGQGCVLATRLLVPEHLMGAYRDGVKEAQKGIKIGDPRDPSTTLGPLIREQQRARVESYVASGNEQGAELIAGGKRPADQNKGFFYEPTVFVGDNGMKIAQEEIFGPVLTVIPYSGKDDDAVRIANDSIYGLGGVVEAAGTARAFNVARRIRAGSMNANGVKAPPASDPGPGGGQGPGWGYGFGGIGQTGAFGGYKQSGLGREWGRMGLEEFTEVKNLTWR